MIANEKMFLSDSLKIAFHPPPIDLVSLNQCIPLVPTISSKGYLLYLLYIHITSPVGWADRCSLKKKKTFYKVRWYIWRG